MFYPGDSYTFLLTITLATGAGPTITTAPVITVVNLSTGSAVVTGQTMTAITGTSSQVYKYIWNTAGLADGDYIGLVSYAHDSITINSQLLEKVHLGDSRVVGVVAQDATVAKDGTVAKDSTVAHTTDLVSISPNNSSVVLAIKAKTDLLPATPADNATLIAVQSAITDIHNAVMGTWVIDKTQSPQVLTFFNSDSSVLARFQLSDGPTATNRTKF